MVTLVHRHGTNEYVCLKATCVQPFLIFLNLLQGCALLIPWPRVDAYHSGQRGDGNIQV